MRIGSPDIRLKADAAYAHIMKHTGASDEAHDAVYTRVLDPVFICWQNLPDTTD